MWPRSCHRLGQVLVRSSYKVWETLVISLAAGGERHPEVIFRGVDLNTWHARSSQVRRTADTVVKAYDLSEMGCNRILICKVVSVLQLFL